MHKLYWRVAVLCWEHNWNRNINNACHKKIKTFEQLVYILYKSKVLERRNITYVSTKTKTQKKPYSFGKVLHYSSKLKINESMVYHSVNNECHTSYSSHMNIEWTFATSVNKRLCRVGGSQRQVCFPVHSRVCSSKSVWTEFKSVIDALSRC